MDLVFVSSNSHKVSEIQKVVDKSIKILSLKDILCFDDIEETETTFQGNALLKANYISKKLHLNCFADDSGLEVHALNGEPGVYSSRYAGEPKNDENNTQKLLFNLEGITNRNANFKTVIALIFNLKPYFFEGKIEGTISKEKRGLNGFGYDPVFIPIGHSKTFAEMNAEEKNSISHRALAIQQMTAFLKSRVHSQE